ncbi:MAG: imidazole glycerol phosphate synthase subunit HisF [candidate division Zixibacteria bacterium RBG_16_53_22]|nr:MAG: imidazole glycerol phosphate synthase subunit HisF [candidate division Zixibacteria bacterium RBG_16_53_22]
MVTVRIIPCLDVEDGKVVKGTRFKDVRYAGDPVELARLYDEQGADEIVFLDISATHRTRKIMIDVVEKVSECVFVPLTVGGGLCSVTDIREVLSAGADKAAICSAALTNPNLIMEAAAVFGSQCVVLSIDAKKTGNSWHAFVEGGRKDTGVDALDWALRGEKLGAGEILLNSIDSDGTRSGYDLELTRLVVKRATIPVIASGGAGSLEQVYAAITIGKADAILIASLLHYREYTIADVKSYLRERGVRVR